MEIRGPKALDNRPQKTMVCPTREQSRLEHLGAGIGRPATPRLQSRTSWPGSSLPAGGPSGSNGKGNRRMDQRRRRDPQKLSFAVRVPDRDQEKVRRRRNLDFKPLRESVLEPVKDCGGKREHSTGSQSNGISGLEPQR